MDVSLELERGTFTVVTGRIGSGKTTLLRALLGLLPKDAGEIRWNGELVEDPASFFVPPRSSYTGQIPLLFSESIRDNILMGLPKERVDLPGAVWKAVLDQDLDEDLNHAPCDARFQFTVSLSGMLGLCGHSLSSCCALNYQMPGRRR